VTEPAFAASRRDLVHAAVLAEQALALRFFSPQGDRLLIVNLGRDLSFASVAEPLLAPALGRRWGTAWSSEDPRYGGGGTAPVDTDDALHLPGHAALVLAPQNEKGR
jgi:maltooligosyltrehalose trehalohydrolase